MSKQTKPKVSDLVEILLLQIKKLEETISKYNQDLDKIPQTLNNIEVAVDLSELKTLKQANLNNLKSSFNEFHEIANKNNELILRIYKKMKSKHLLYLLILNVFFFLTTVSSVYIAISNSIQKSEHQTLINEKTDLESKLKFVGEFFIEHPKATIKYKEWSKNQ